MEKGELQDFVDYFQDTVDGKNLVSFYKTDLKPRDKEEIKNYEKYKMIYEALFKDSFTMSYFSYFYLLRDKSYLVKYIVIEFFLKRRFSNKKLLENVISEYEADSVFVKFFRTLLMDYDFEGARKLLPQCLEELKELYFFVRKWPEEGHNITQTVSEEKIAVFEKNAKWFIYLYYLKVYKSKNFSEFFKEDQKDKKNEAIAVSVFLKSKMKCRYNEDGELEVFKKYKKKTPSYLSSIFNENFAFRMNMLNLKLK